jgi:hypothetical protein
MAPMRLRLAGPVVASGCGVQWRIRRRAGVSRDLLPGCRAGDGCNGSPSCQTAHSQSLLYSFKTRCTIEC